MASLTIAAPAFGPSAWVVSALPSVASVVALDASQADRIALYASDSNATPPGAGTLVAILDGSELSPAKS